MDLETILAFFQPAALRDVILSDQYSDVMINADRTVFVDCGGRLQRVSGLEAGDLMVAIQTIARLIGKDINRDRPHLDARLPDGSRLAAVLGQDGSLDITIRKFNRWYTTDELITAGSLPEFVRDILVSGVCGRNGDAANIIFSGGTSSGKSTQTNALIDHIPSSRRLIVIEKPRELKLANHPHAVRWEAEEAVPGTPQVRSVAQYLMSALRQRPDHIVIGEIREPEAAYEALQAMNTGHSGTISTVHADSAQDALYRLRDLALAARSNLGQTFVTEQVWRTINYVCHAARDANGKRRVVELLQVGRDGHHARLYPEKATLAA